MASESHFQTLSEVLGFTLKLLSKQGSTFKVSIGILAKGSEKVVFILFTRFPRKHELTSSESS